MEVIETNFPGLLIIKHRLHRDNRGSFQELFHREKARNTKLATEFVQDNLSRSHKDVLRGFHYQLQQPQAKLIQVLAGRVYDVVVDLRQDSPTFGNYFDIELNEEDGHQLFVPEGFAHGFLALTDDTRVYYKCSAHYEPDDQYGIRWDDPELDIPWPTTNPILSDRDAGLPHFPEASLPGDADG